MITTDSIKTAVTKIAQLIEESADELNSADGLLGDGEGQQEIQVEEISALLNDALDAMKQRGKAELGDKTVLDVIAASSQAAKDQSDGSSVLKAINDAVTSTIDEFRSRQSKIGRARIFSEKSIGLDDPGMLAFRKMLEALS